MLTDLDWVTASWPSFRPAWGSRPDGQPRSRARQPLAIGALHPSPAGRVSGGTAAAGEPPGRRDLSAPIPGAARGDQIHASARVGEADLPALEPRDTLHPRRRVATVLLRLRSLLLERRTARDARESPGLPQADQSPASVPSDHPRAQLAGPKPSKGQQQASFSCTFSCKSKNRVPGFAENPCSD